MRAKIGTPVAFEVKKNGCNFLAIIFERGIETCDTCFQSLR